jgi:hypothetical protein
MEKLGVVIDDSNVKTSSAGRRVCPKCGTELPGNQQVDQPDRNGDVYPPWWCPRCGTEPFEKRP